MEEIRYKWQEDGSQYELVLVPVAGTGAEGYRFGGEPQGRMVTVSPFWAATVPVTQALWTHVMGAESNCAHWRAPNLPMENVSWDALTAAAGFLQRINAGPVRGNLPGRFRLPTETEWEYAARGGPHWRDGFRFSGANQIEPVGWYGRRDGNTHPVASKEPNQLGLYDMSGNVWEWCQDVYVEDVRRIPADGSWCSGPGADRVLRGGCFHNWAEHCTVSKRYAIVSDAHDECIGFRLFYSE